MRRGHSGLAVAFVAAAAVGGAGAAHASSREVMVPALPEGYPMVVATPDGGAWLLGDLEPGYFGPRALWRIDPSLNPTRSAPRSWALPRASLARLLPSATSSPEADVRRRKRATAELFTVGEACLAGSCQGGTVVGVVDNGTTTTVTCPPTATAVDGIVQTTCTFPQFLDPNNIFTGPVQLISHLTRDFGSFDILPIDATTVQVACVYETADGEQIGGIYRFLPFPADRCTPTADSFICTH